MVDAHRDIRRVTADSYQGHTTSTYRSWLQDIDPRTAGAPAYTSYIGAKVAQHFETGWGVGVVCCIAADPRLKSVTRTPAPDALRPTKSQPFSIIWEDNTDSVVDLRTLLQIVRNHEQGLHKPSTSIPPPTSNGASAQSSVVSQDLRGLERHFWRGTEAGCLGCYDFSGETWAGDGSMHKGVMGAGSICLQRPTCNLVVRVGREEEGVSSLRPELAAMARTLQAAPAESDLIYLCDSEAALNKISRWIGSGSRTTLAGDANADIMVSIIECVQARVKKGARTFMVKVKAHRGEPLNELADTQAENARQLPNECRQWTVRTPSMTYEWSDNNGVEQTTAWSKTVRKAMVRGGAEYQVQEANESCGDQLE